MIPQLGESTPVGFFATRGCEVQSHPFQFHKEDEV